MEVGSIFAEEDSKELNLFFVPDLGLFLKVGLQSVVTGYGISFTLRRFLLRFLNDKKCTEN